jgi:hypothetical protein
MKTRREHVNRKPASGQSSSGVSAPAGGTLTLLKDAWPFALSGFVIGLLAAIFINKRNQRSGVTTQAQLRAAANTLHKLNTGAIGFVLSRLRSAIADPAFRRSQHDMEQQPSDHGASGSMWSVRWHGIVEKPLREPEHAAGNDLPPTESEPAPGTPNLREPSTAQEFSKAPAEATTAESVEPAAEQMPSDAESSLEGLRGLFANVGLEGLHRNRGPLPQGVPDTQPTALPSEKAAEPPSTARLAAALEKLTPTGPVPVPAPVKETKPTPGDATPPEPEDDIRILPSRRGQYGSR